MQDDSNLRTFEEYEENEKQRKNQEGNARDVTKNEHKCKARDSESTNLWIR